MIMRWFTLARGFLAAMPSAQRVLLVAAVIALLLPLHNCAADRAITRAVLADRQAQANKAAARALVAEHKADEAAILRGAEDAAQANKTRKALDDAMQANPDAARLPAGSHVRAVADSLR